MTLQLLNLKRKRVDKKFPDRAHVSKCRRRRVPEAMRDLHARQRAHKLMFTFSCLLVGVKLSSGGLQNE